MVSENEHLTFGLIHGAWHGAWCWDKVVPLLEGSGHNAVAIDLPTENPTLNFNDYAEIAADQLEAFEDIVLVGHSRGGNVVPRMAGKLTIRQMVYIGGSFQPPTLAFLGDKADCLPQRQSEALKSGIRHVSDALTLFDRDKAADVFYHDCTPQDQQWAISKLRLQRRASNEPELSVWPDNIRQDYIVCTDDRAVNPAWSRAICKILGIKIHEIEASHSPFISKPQELSKLLLAIAA